ncbi:MAG: hypothetical protein WCL29_08765 [Pseudomonadota bacterium]
MVKDINYMLLVNGQMKRMNTDLQRLQVIASEYMDGENKLTIRCPQSGGSGAQSAVLTYNKGTQKWVKMK